VPIPVAQSLGTVTVQYKDFGTQIDFVPIVLGNGNIRLEVRPEITEVDPSLRDATTGVPGFRRRFADTAVEMRAGQTMAIAGLIYYRTDVSNKGVPWLADMPWIGAAFRRTRETSNEVELVITVTPEFVEAMDPEQVPNCGPGMLTQSPSDTELYWRGYMEVPRCDGKCDVGGTGVAPDGVIPGPAPGGNVSPYMGTKARTIQKQDRPQQVAGPTQASPQGMSQAQSQPQTSRLKASQPVTSQVSVRKEPAIPSRQVSPPPAVRGAAATPTGTRVQLSDEPQMIGPLGYEPLR
jgi:pilus assembly protein CpaC